MGHQVRLELEMIRSTVILKSVQMISSEFRQRRVLNVVTDEYVFQVEPSSRAISQNIEHARSSSPSEASNAPSSTAQNNGILEYGNILPG